MAHLCERCARESHITFCDVDTDGARTRLQVDAHVPQLLHLALLLHLELRHDRVPVTGPSDALLLRGPLNSSSLQPQQDFFDRLPMMLPEPHMQSDSSSTALSTHSTATHMSSSIPGMKLQLGGQNLPEQLQAAAAAALPLLLADVPHACEMAQVHRNQGLNADWRQLCGRAQTMSDRKQRQGNETGRNSDQSVAIVPNTAHASSRLAQSTCDLPPAEAAAVLLELSEVLLHLLCCCPQVRVWDCWSAAGLLGSGPESDSFPCSAPSRQGPAMIITQKSQQV